LGALIYSTIHIYEQGKDKEAHVLEPETGRAALADRFEQDWPARVLV